jgi:glutamyl-tRNA synthetase
VLDYADEGYLPEALLNFLTIMGWALDDKTEIMSREELIAGFNLADLNPAPATFDSDKLEWMNGVYMRQLPEDDLADRFRKRLEHDLPASIARPLDQNLIASFTPLIRERVKLLSEVVELTDFFFTDEIPTLPANELLGRSFRKQPERAAPALASAANALESLQDNWYAEPLESALRATAEELDIRAGDLFMVCRVAITGKRVTPPLFETMEIVEAQLCLERIRSAENILRAAHPDEPVAKTD